MYSFYNNVFFYVYSFYPKILVEEILTCLHGYLLSSRRFNLICIIFKDTK